jgi:hypothetical protein
VIPGNLVIQENLVTLVTPGNLVIQGNLVSLVTLEIHLILLIPEVPDYHVDQHFLGCLEILAIQGNLVIQGSLEILVIPGNLEIHLTPAIPVIPVIL